MKEKSGMRRRRWKVRVKQIRWRGKLLAEGERKTGGNPNVSCFKCSRKDKSICSQTDVIAAKNNWTLWL